jgi:hypothetical protein
VTLERETYDLFLSLKEDITMTLAMAKHQSNDTKLQQKLNTITKELQKLRSKITKLIQLDRAKSIEGQTRL